MAFWCISLSLPRPQLTALPTLGAGRLPRCHSSVGIAPARTYAVVFPCPVPSPNSHRADRCGAHSALRWAPAGATCGFCCSREPLFAAVCPRCLINPYPPHDLRPLAAMLSSGSKASELGKLWEQRGVSYECTRSLCLASQRAFVLPGALRSASVSPTPGSRAVT